MLKINDKEKILKLGRGGNLAYNGNTVSYEQISQGNHKPEDNGMT